MGGTLIEDKHPPNFLCPVFPHMTVAETGGALVEVWDGIITFQSKGRSPRPRMMHCSQDAHHLGEAGPQDPHQSLPPALTWTVSQLLVILPALALSDLVGVSSVFHYTRLSAFTFAPTFLGSAWCFPMTKCGLCPSHWDGAAILAISYLAPCLQGDQRISSLSHLLL